MLVEVALEVVAVAVEGLLTVPGSAILLGADVGSRVEDGIPPTLLGADVGFRVDDGSLLPVPEPAVPLCRDDGVDDGELPVSRPAIPLGKGALETDGKP